MAEIRPVWRPPERDGALREAVDLPRSMSGSDSPSNLMPPWIGVCVMLRMEATRSIAEKVASRFIRVSD